MSLMPFTPLHRVTPLLRAPAAFGLLEVLTSLDGISAGDSIEQAGPGAYRIGLDVPAPGGVRVELRSGALRVEFASGATGIRRRVLALAPDIALAGYRRDGERVLVDLVRVANPGTGRGPGGAEITAAA